MNRKKHFEMLNKLFKMLSNILLKIKDYMYILKIKIILLLNKCI